MGSPLVIFNKDGSIMKKISYDPLGKLESDSNPGFQFIFGDFVYRKSIAS
jgi:hypothetical protein